MDAMINVAPDDVSAETRAALAQHDIIMTTAIAGITNIPPDPTTILDLWKLIAGRFEQINNHLVQKSARYGDLSPNLTNVTTDLRESLTALDINLSIRIKTMDKNLKTLANNFTGKLNDATKDMSLLQEKIQQVELDCAGITNKLADGEADRAVIRAELASEISTLRTSLASDIKSKVNHIIRTEIPKKHKSTLNKVLEHVSTTFRAHPLPLNQPPPDLLNNALDSPPGSLFDKFYTPTSPMMVAADLHNKPTTLPNIPPPLTDSVTHIVYAPRVCGLCGDAQSSITILLLPSRTAIWSMVAQMSASLATWASYWMSLTLILSKYLLLLMAPLSHLMIVSQNGLYSR
jgi:hypothetical protein